MTFFVEGLTSLPDREQEVRHIGAYATLDEAVLAARRVIDEFLAIEFAPGMPPARLFARYQSHGEVPIIFRDDDDKTLNVGAFNHFEYALARCAELALSPGEQRS
jgi:hypothetical protein